VKNCDRKHQPELDRLGSTEVIHRTLSILAPSCDHYITVLKFVVYFIALRSSRYTFFSKKRKPHFHSFLSSKAAFCHQDPSCWQAVPWWTYFVIIFRLHVKLRLSNFQQRLVSLWELSTKIFK